MELEDKKIELRSDEVQEILGRPPRWILKWGITLQFSLYILLFVGSWFYKYPKIITADISIKENNIGIENNFIGEIKILNRDTNLIKVGQVIKIKFDTYPYMKFGKVVGKVKSISIDEIDANYIIVVELPNGLKTNNGIQLPYRQEMKGSADIITEEISLIERMLTGLNHSKK